MPIFLKKNQNKRLNQISSSCTKPKPKKEKTYYWRVKKPEEYDEDDKQFTEDKLSDYYFKPLAEAKTIKTPAKMQEFFLLIESLFFLKEI